MYEVMDYIMGKRITIVLDDDLFKKLRERQSRQIRDSPKSVSFSRVINQAIRKGIK